MFLKVLFLIFFYTKTIKCNINLLNETNQTNDPTCERGIRHWKYCCSPTCINENNEPQCGGTGCADLPGGREGCCGGTITNLNNSCDNNTAPCIINLIDTEKTTTLITIRPTSDIGDKSCEKGIKHWKYCCSSTCINENNEPQCGGAGCADLPGGKENCCGGPININNHSCNIYEAPCILSLEEYCTKDCNNTFNKNYNIILNIILFIILFIQ